ncbi:MAG: outer membrane protein assembly factor BamA [Deferribacterota bacterium]|nr:outer membrane protein assembly factor BamA [Deferribacterota bacterium]
MLLRCITGFIIFFILGSNLLFAATITKVKVVGNKRISDNKVLEYAVKPNTEFSFDLIDKSIKKMYASGYFYDIKVDLSVEGEDLVLTYIVKEKPYVNSIYFEGNKELSSDKLVAIISLKGGDILDFKKINKAIEEIRKEYENKSYYNVDISYDIEEAANGDVDVVFSIDEGSKAMVEKITFLGNKEIDNKRLKKVIATKEKWFLSWLTGSGHLKREDLMLDRDRIRNEYYNNGFIKVQVGEPEVKVHKKENYLEVIFRIQEGPQYKVGEISFEGNEHLTNEELEKRIELKSGDIFGSQVFRNDIERLTKAFTAIGYAFANVNPKTYIDDNTRTVDITYSIEENRLVKINRIIIEGNVKTRDRVIRRELKIVEGETYSSEKIELSKKALERLDYFEEVNFIEEPLQLDKIDLKINVKEKSTGTFTVGAGFSTLDGIVGLFQIRQSNLFGLGYSARLTGELGTERSRFIINFTNSWLFDKPITFGVDVFRWEDEYFDYDERITGAAVRLGHPIIGRKLYIIYRLAYEQFHISDIEEEASWEIKKFRGDMSTISIAPTIEWNTIDFPADPSKGNQTKLMLKYAGFGGDSEFIKAVFSSKQYQPLFWKFVGMVNGEIGYIKEFNDKEIPLNERFYLGGMHSVRGYEYGEISPEDESGFEYGGDKYLLFNAEAVFPISEEINLKGVVFFDAGNVWEDGESILSSDLKRSVGAGIRWRSPFGPIRVEYGIKLDKEHDESRGRLDFSVGGMF